MDDKPKETKKLGVFPQDKAINPERLADELKTALGDKLLQVDTGQMKEAPRLDAKGQPVLDEAGKPITEQTGPFIYVVVSGEATEADLAIVEQVLKVHDPNQLSARQQRDSDAAEAYARLAAADLGAIRKLEQAEKVDKLIDLMEDWQRLMVAARG